MPVNVNELLKALEQSNKARTTPPPQLKPLLPVGLSPSTGNPQIDMAKTLLANANVNWQNLANMKDIPLDRDSSGPSVISRIFDVLSRPNYAVANMFKTLSDTKDDGLLDVLGAGARGLSGTDKTTFSDVIQQNNDINTGVVNSEINPILKYGGGFAADVLLDPTTYIGVGAIKSVGKALGLVNDVDELAKIPSNPTNFELPIPKKLESPVAIRNLITTKDTPINPITSLSNEKFAPLISSNDIKISNSAKAQLDEINKITEQKISKEDAIKRQSTLARENPDIPISQLQLLNNNPFAVLLPDEIRNKIAGLNLPETAEKVIFQNRGTNEELSDSLNLVNFLGDSFPNKIESELDRIVLRDNVLNSLGPSSPSELSSSFKIADKFATSTLSKPNKFAKGTTPPAVYNPAQQANLANRIANHSRKTKGKLNTFRMLRSAEDRLIQAGYNPSFWDGTNIRLTDVILELAENADDIPKIMDNHLTQVITAFKLKNPNKIADPSVRQAIDTLRARSAITEAPTVNDVINRALQKKDILSENASMARLNDLQKVIEREAAIKLEAQAISPGSILSAQRLLRDIHVRDTQGTEALAETYAKRYRIQRYLEGGKEKWAPIQEAQTKGIEQITQVKARDLASRIGQSNRAVDWFLTRVATWYGQKDLRPEVLLRSTTATNNASARARVWNEFSKKYSPEQIHDAFRAAQKIKPASTPEVQEAADFLSNAMETMFSASGITREAERASSVAERSGLLMQDINDQLKNVNSNFKFTNKSDIMDDVGNKYDYSKGTDWLKSWEIAKIDDPLDFMFRLGTAVEQVLGKYAFYDELAARWGSTLKSSQFNTKIKSLTKINKPRMEMHEGYFRSKLDGTPRKVRESLPKHHRLDGIYFPREIVSQVDKVLSTWDQLYNNRSELVRLLDRVTRAWKSGVTIYAPAHHIRNLIGDVYLSWNAGVTNPSVYNKAAKVIFSEKGRYTDLESVENLTSKTALNNALTKPGDIVTKSGSGHPLTAEQIYVAAHQTGLLVHANVIEELFGDPLIKWQPLGGKGKELAHNVSENREHFTRLAHFIDIIEKSKERNLSTLFKNASHEVRKYHPDGSDLTDFERNVMRRIIPFYSWTRKAIPLLVEGALLNPGKTTVYPKGMLALQGMMGIESPGIDDPFPLDQLFPDWIREKGVGPIAEHGMEGLPGLIASMSRSITGFDGQPSGYTVVNPSNPLIDVVAQYAGMGRPEDPIKGIGQGLTPLFRIPSEIIQGQTFSGAPIEPGRYIAEQIPIASLLSRISNVGVFGPTQRGIDEGLGNQEAIWNLLTALGIQGTGPYIKTSEFQERDRRRELNGN